jgi:hypothetical protein
MQPAHYERQHYARCPHCPADTCVLCGHRQGQRKTARHCERCRRYAAPLLRVDWFRKTREHKAKTCHCGWYHFPHRRGSLWCAYGAGGRLGLSFFDSGTEYALHWRQGFIHLLSEHSMDLQTISAANRQLHQAREPDALRPVLMNDCDASDVMADQLGQNLLNLDLLAQRLGIDLGTAAAQAFNRLSEKAGQPMRLHVERAA